MDPIQTRAEARTMWDADRAALRDAGLDLFGASEYLSRELLAEGGEMSIAKMAMDAQFVTATDPNAAIPAMLTTTIDPDVIDVIFAPLAMAQIVGGERKAGTWLDETRIFPVVEETGEVSSYGDYANNGRAGVNFNYPQLQSYNYQTIIGYGEREVERAGLMRINYVGSLQKAANNILARFTNLSYAFGIQNLQNYGIINNPFLSAYITPAVKAWGGTSWFNSGSPAATANEVYNDILALVERLINQTNGAVEMDAPMTLAMSPQSQLAMKFANSFGVSVSALLKEGFPNMVVKAAPQYGSQTTTNPQGYSVAGNALQLIAHQVGGEETSYAAFTEKMKTFRLIGEMSAWKQKAMSGTWGTVLRLPVGVTGMLGV